MNKDYIFHLFYFQPASQTFQTLITAGQEIDTQINNLKSIELRQKGIVFKGNTPSSSTGFAKLDLNAMGIDATRFDTKFAGLKEETAITDKWKEVIKEKCTTCGSCPTQKIQLVTIVKRKDIRPKFVALIS